MVTRWRGGRSLAGFVRLEAMVGSAGILGGQVKRFLSVWMLALFTSGTAHAECASAYVPAEMGVDLSTLTVSLRSLEEGKFRAAGVSLEAGLLCLQTQVPKAVYASAYRYLGARAFLEGDEEVSRGWFRIALELDPNYEWDIMELPVGHPLRALFEQERSGAQSEAVSPVGKVLAVPEGAVIFLDGRALQVAEATQDRPHLIQVVTEGGREIQAIYRMDGAAFPEAVLTETNVEDGGEDLAAAPPVRDSMAIQTVQRVRPTLKTPLLLGGGVVIASGIGIYGASFGARAEFDSVTTTADLDRARATTNMLVSAAGATIGLGLGMSGVGLLLHGGTGFSFSMGF
jgi:hypothetical protein